MYICTVHVCLNYYYNNNMTDYQETLFIGFIKVHMHIHVLMHTVR